MKPVGLTDPRTGKAALRRRAAAPGEPLRTSTASSAFRRGSPGRSSAGCSALRLQQAEFVRLGVMHRNTYLHPDPARTDAGAARCGPRARLPRRAALLRRTDDRGGRLHRVGGDGHPAPERRPRGPGPRVPRAARTTIRRADRLHRPWAGAELSADELQPRPAAAAARTGQEERAPPPGDDRPWPGGDGWGGARAKAERATGGA